MHIDTDRGRIKAGFYLSEVSIENGPFSYIMGSNRARMSLCERAMRIASDTCGLDGPSKHSTRRRFMTLPKHSRTKANFGNDLDDASGQSARLVEKEKRFTSADGDLVLFDNRGFHRGGIVDKGERIVVFVIMG
jgi:hypothetical protein